MGGSDWQRPFYVSTRESLSSILWRKISISDMTEWIWSLGVFQSSLFTCFEVKHKAFFTTDLQAFMASSEETPLLSTENNAGHDQLDDSDVYLRFSSTRKKIILAMVSGCIVIHCMFIYSKLACRSTSDVWIDCMNETFTPSIPQIAKELNSTGAVVKWSISNELLAKKIYFLFSV